MTLFAKEGCKIGPVAAQCWPPKSMERAGWGESGVFCNRVGKQREAKCVIFWRGSFVLNQDYIYTCMWLKKCTWYGFTLKSSIQATETDYLSVLRQVNFGGNRWICMQCVQTTYVFFQLDKRLIKIVNLGLLRFISPWSGGLHWERSVKYWFWQMPQSVQRSTCLQADKPVYCPSFRANRWPQVHLPFAVEWEALCSD